MSTWLESMRLGLEKLDVNELIEPEMEIESSDNEVGEADDDLKKLYGYAQLLGKQMKEKSLAAEYERNREHKELYAQQAYELHAKHEILMGIFWISARDAFELWQKPTIGIRSGWKVVWTEPKCPLTDILGNLFKEMGGHDD